MDTHELFEIDPDRDGTPKLRGPVVPGMLELQDELDGTIGISCGPCLIARSTDQSESYVLCN